MAPPERRVFVTLVTLTAILLFLVVMQMSTFPGNITSLNLKRRKVRGTYGLLKEMEMKGEEEKDTDEEEMPDNSTSDIPAPTTRSLYDAGFRFPNPELCPHFGSKKRLVILITSAPSHLEARRAIRLTWGHIQLRKDVVFGFLLGRSKKVNETRVREENALYGDIILANFVDSYKNLTLRATSALEWVDNYCNRAKMFLKTDDDIFINVRRLIDFVKKHWRDERKIFGKVALNWRPFRKKSSKHYVSVQQYKFPVFPNFTTGGAYLMTADVIHDLYEGSLNRTYLKQEDVFTTGIVAQEKNIQRVHIAEFYNLRPGFDPCTVYRVISLHMIAPVEQFDLWQAVNEKKKC